MATRREALVLGGLAVAGPLVTEAGTELTSVKVT
jgi:hypothetical protein